MHAFRASLAAGELQLGLSVMYPSPGVIERIGGDWDWIWIDGQHGELGSQDVLALVRACNLVGRPAIVRVAGHEFGPIGKALDTGAAGVIVPCVDAPDQARKVVAAAKFPPLGKRSYGSRRAIDLHGRNYSDTANDELLLIVQIESPAAIGNAETIASIEGVDALFLGPDDLMLRRGYSMSEPKSKAALGDDMQVVVDACRRHRKIAVMVAANEEMLRLCISMGFSMIVNGGDGMFLAAGSKQSSAQARSIIEQSSIGSTDIALAQSASRI